MMTVLTASLLFLLAFQFYAANSLVLTGYVSLESDKTYMQISNAKKMIALQEKQLLGITQDWAHWDDTFDYILKPNQQYIQKNYNNEVFSNLKINTVILTNNNGEIVFEKSRDFVNSQPWTTPQILKRAASGHGLLGKPTKLGHLSGLVWTPEGLMLVSAMDILPSSLAGTRSGVLIMARLVNTAMLQELEETVGAKVNITYIDNSKNISAEMRNVQDQLFDKNSWFMKPLSKSQVAGYMQLQEIITGNDLILSTISDRKIYQQMQNTSNFFLKSTIVIFTLLLILSWLFDKLVLSRLANLSRSVKEIISSTNLAKRVPTFSGSDEIASLSMQINGMLTNLEERQNALEGAGDGVWDWNIISGQMHYSEKWKLMLGYSDKDTLSYNEELVELIHPDDQLQVRQELHNYLNGLTDVYIAEYRIRCNDNTYKWILDRGMVVSRSNDGLPLRMIGTINDISERKKVDKSLRESEKRYRLLIETANEAVVVAQGNQLKFANNKALELSGYTQNEITQLPFIELIFEQDRLLILNNFQRRLMGEVVEQRYEVRIVKKDGRIRWAEMSGAIIDWEGQTATLNFVSDITDRKEVEKELIIAATAFESQEGMLVTDVNGAILRVNNSFSRITGFLAKDVVGMPLNILTAINHDVDYFDKVWEAINKDGCWEDEISNFRKNGEKYFLHITITAVKGHTGEISNYVATLADITSSKEATEKIHQMAFYDPLTKLPNRRLLLDRINHSLAIATRQRREGAILFLDLDNFKTLNDTQGHDVGDALLKQVAELLTECVREGDTVARIGGDEFVVLLENLSEQKFEAAAQVEMIANKILTALNRPYKLGEQEFHTSVSIGVVLFGDKNRTQEELLKQADIAMYDAKKAGRNNLRFFDPNMQDAINSRAETERDLRIALSNNEFQLYYQLQVDRANNPLGAEALIRWIHPERGLVPPLKFISLAEDTGLIFPIGLWVLESACAQLKAWEQNERTKNLSLSINVSAKQFSQANFVSQVKMVLERYEVNPTLLKLELTESMLINNIDSILHTMEALQDVGVRFELDDFGTGYSSLQYLKQLPLYQLKIDRSFVRDIVTDNSDQAIVRTIIGMAKSLNLVVIAEGVETEDQLKFLIENGCNNFQGYFFSKPVPIDDFELMIKCCDNKLQ